MNLARYSTSRSTHQLFSVAGNTGPVLGYAYSATYDHLHGRIMSDGERSRDLVPDSYLWPANEAM
jgi:hypothetical protein